MAKIVGGAQCLVLEKGKNGFISIHIASSKSRNCKFERRPTVADVMIRHFEEAATSSVINSIKVPLYVCIQIGEQQLPFNGSSTPASGNIQRQMRANDNRR